MKKVDCNRNEKIDVLKGIAILLVVIGHSVCEVYDSKTFNTNIIFKFCYSFHMPLFFYISGYLVGMKATYTNEWIKRKFKTLMIPYFFWTLVHIFVDTNANIIYAFFVTPIYWYLINLFLYDCITWFSDKKKYSFIFELLIYLIICIIYVLEKNNLVMKNVILFMVFYLAGKYISKYKIDILTFKITKASVILFPISLILFTYKEYDKYATYLVEVTGIDQKWLFKGAMYFYNHIIVAFLGILFCLFIVDLAKHHHAKGKVWNSLIYLGKVTLPIYILHEYFFLKYEANILYMLFSILISIFISVLIYEVCSQFLPRMCVIIFGNRSNLIKDKYIIERNK